jgi:hypothetical protein
MTYNMNIEFSFFCVTGYFLSKMSKIFNVLLLKVSTIWKLVFFNAYTTIANNAVNWFLKFYKLELIIFRENGAGLIPNSTYITKLYDKRDDFNFHIVNFPFICSNIPAAPAYGVYISQLIRYSRACSSYQDFLDRGLLLIRKLLNQRFLLVKLNSSLRKFCDRHHDLVDCYGISVSQMTTDMFHLS